MYGIMLACVAVVGLSGCGKVLGELRADSDAVIDNGTAVVSQTVGMVSGILKQVVKMGVAIYDLGKSVVDDTQDNVNTAMNAVTGAGETPAAPGQ